jgi:hypothetical protein
MTVATADMPTLALRLPRISASSIWHFAVVLAVLLALAPPLLFLILGIVIAASLARLVERMNIPVRHVNDRDAVGAMRATDHR